MHLAVSEAISLTEIRPTDRSAYLEHLSNPDVAHFLLRIPYPYTEADADAWLEMVAKNVREPNGPTWFAIRNADDFLIGGIGFEDMARGHAAEVGYWLAKPYWGRGIMTGVIGRACAHAFDHWQLVRIVAYVFDFNTASARVLEKNGFLLEGTFRKHRLKAGTFLDSKVYALVR